MPKLFRFHVLAALALVPCAAFADIKVYKNDSLPLSGMGTVACQAGFVSNEIGAAVFTVPPADGTILLLDAQFFACDGSGFGLAQPRPVQVLIYPAGGPNPGAPTYTSPTLSAGPGFLNSWPLTTEGLTFGAGSTFTVGVKLLAGTLFQSFTTLSTDADGCQSGKSLIFAVPGGWTDACSLGVSGDMFVRARVLTEGPVPYGAGTAGAGGQVPAIGSSGPWFTGSTSFAVTCANVLGGAPGFLGFSTGSASIPLFGGTVLINPVATGATFLPVAASGGGTVSTTTPIPANPAIIGVHVFFQYGFLDAGAAGGVSMSRGLDVKISNDS